MLVKKIVKRGIKDMTFINKFLSEKLNGKSSAEVNINENVYNKICKRNGRELNYYGKSENDLKTGLFFNNMEYAFQIGDALNGKYGTYYKMKVVDIQKTTKDNLNNRIANCNLEGDAKYLYLDLFKHQEINMFNPFSMNLEDSKLLDSVQYEIEKEIINNIDNTKEIINETQTKAKTRLTAKEKYSAAIQNLVVEQNGRSNKFISVLKENIPTVVENILSISKNYMITEDVISDDIGTIKIEKITKNKTELVVLITYKADKVLTDKENMIYGMSYIQDQIDKDILLSDTLMYKRLLKDKLVQFNN